MRAKRALESFRAICWSIGGIDNRTLLNALVRIGGSKWAGMKSVIEFILLLSCPLREDTTNTEEKEKLG